MTPLPRDDMTLYEALLNEFFLLCSRRKLGPRRAHLRWRPVFKMAAARLISPASVAALLHPPASIYFKGCHLNQCKSTKDIRKIMLLFASAFNIFMIKMIFVLKNDGKLNPQPDNSTEKILIIILIHQILIHCRHRFG